MGQTTKEKGRIRVLIADDHAVVRQGLRGFLELQPNIEVVGEAVDGMDAVEKAQALRPNVVLMDLVMPRMDGAQATRAIRTAAPSTQVIALTSFSEDEQVFASIKAGAAGYLMKDIQPNALAAAIEKVARGEPTLHPEIARKIMQELGTPPTQKPLHPRGSKELEPGLTEREIEVLRLIARGRSNREIADELALSEKTVKTHVSNILQKLHLSDRTKAALYAVRRRLVDVDKDVEG
ncbi:MAG: DNA-binding response regulator [Candidatus Chloroheliales bacterium]|nr:MAG: DNA-binding response regulator [Chloroflexota bacterium]